MNARLSSLLVAGSVFVAGSPSMPLAAYAPAAEGAPGASLQGASLASQDARSASLKLDLPGYAGTPRLQVLSNPLRIVVDLPGVDRGTQPSRKDLAALQHPLILKTRLAQFEVAPTPVTRLVLEVKEGTQVLVGTVPGGVMVNLNAGTGASTARLMPGLQAPASRPSAEPAADVAPVVVSMPVLPKPMETEVLTASASPEAPAPETKAPETKAAEKVAAAPAAAEPAPVPARVETKVAETRPEPAPEAPQPALTAPKAPLQAMPAVGASVQSLPSLSASSLLPLSLGSAATAAAPAPLQVPRDSQARSGKTLADAPTLWKGSKMSIDVQNADIKVFLGILADAGHLNLVMDQDVQGIYNFKFTDTPWDQILDVVLKNAGLGKEIQNGVLRVAKIKKLQEEEEDRRKLDEAKALAGPLQSITRPLSYAKVAEVKSIIEKMLTKRGSVILDDRTNTLIITDLSSNLVVIDDLISQLDVQIQQVQIEARVVEATGSYEKAFGVKWPTANTGAADLTVGGVAAPWGAFDSPSWNSVNNRPGLGQNAAAVAFTPGKEGVTSINSPAGEFWVSFLSNRFSVNFILQALEKDGKIKIVSSPKVVTQNNKKAKILAGEKIPYPTQQGGAQGGAITVAFADANLELDVTPQITNEGTIIMDIKVEKAEADFSRTVNGTPTILRKAIETQVLVRDGGTAILGGVYSNTTSDGTNGVPFLSKLPLIGWLFRNKTHEEKNAELLIFITPRIIKN
ncbi:MAG: type IV pilus secretin PilQ [Holophagaceae bacterium]